MREALEHLRRSDPVLRGIIERVGPFRIEYREPTFATLARAIIFQQLAGAAAARIFDRFAALVHPRPLTAEAVTRLPIARLCAAGLSFRKATYIRDLAGKTAAGAVRFGDLPRLPDDRSLTP